MRRVFLPLPFVVGLLLPACMTADHQAVELPLPDHPKPPPPGPPSPYAQQLAALDRVTGPTGTLAHYVHDVHLVLEAEDREARGDLPGAVQVWFDALKEASGKIGEKALHGWLKAYTKNLGKASDKVVLARLVMAETQDGKISPYMQAKRLTTDEAITPVLIKTVPDALLADTSGRAPGTPETQPPPPAANGVPPGDPVLVKAAAKSCAAKKAQLVDWSGWVQSLEPVVRQYWQTLLEQTCGEAQAAMTAFKALIPTLAKDAPTQAMAVEATSRLVALQRANGLRTEAADTYVELMKLWTKPGVTPETMGMDDVSMALRRIDETLYASRYRALIGDYETGKIYAQKALDLINGAHGKKGLKQAAREQLASLRAEAYHALAFRIAVERKEFESAYSLTLVALQTPDLSRDWQEKLLWAAGLYEYLGGHFDGAKKRWTALLAKTHDDSLKASLRFWLAKTYEKLGSKTEMDAQLAQLADEYPLSFYAAVASTVSGFKGVPDWRETFGDPAKLTTKLTTKGDWNLAKLRKSKTLGPLLSRAEILTLADMGDLARLAVDELEAAMGPDMLLETNASAWLYLTRLQYASGSYLKAIGITTKMSRAIPQFWKKYPEQLLIYFPRPYAQTFETNAQANALDTELLLGISRQESGFSPEIRSNANAVGLMQLIHPTGRRFAAELGMPTDHIDDTLKNPESNIRIGSRYLKFLSLNFKGFPPAVYGGYNAGEYAVQLWLERRGHTDPMMFVELVPFAETKDYVKNVWRNVVVYKYLQRTPPPAAKPALDLVPVNSAH